MTLFAARKRRRATDLAPSLIERIPWRQVATGAGMLAGVALVAMLLLLALDRPVQRVLGPVVPLPVAGKTCDPP